MSIGQYNWLQGGRRLAAGLLIGLALILVNIALSTPTAAQSGPVRLGEFRVEWYCNNRGLGVTLTNNSADWACTNPDGSINTVLGQSDFDAICRQTYSRPDAFAMRDGRNPVPAYNWSCYYYTAPTATPIPTQPPPPPGGVTLRLGEFRVEWYCNNRGMGVAIINNESDWACTNPNGSINTVLGQGDFNTICRQTYNRPDAFAVRDGNRPQGAYNWSCYVIQVPTATPVPPVPPGASRVRLGAFQVEWYCNNRGLGVRLANEERDWACLNPNGDVSFVLGQADYDAICRQTYNNPGAYALRDGVRAQHAYNWSCYVLNFAPTPAPPFGTVPARLGGLDVTAYCAGRGLGASITATNTDWACLNADRSINFVLTKNDYDTLCRNQYRNAQAVARIEGTNPVAAYNWACVVYRQPTPIWTPAPPRPSPTRLGPLNPAPYCQGLGYRLALSTDQRDWACVSPNGSARITLGPAQYHILCRQAYNDPRAYALRDGTSPIPAYDWACFTFR